MAPSDPVLTSAGYLLLKAGHHIGLVVDAALGEVGLSSKEYLALATVESSPGWSQQEVSDRLGVDPTIVVALVDALEDRGLLVRRRDPADRRRNLLEVTERGRDVHARAVEAATAAEADFLAPLSAGERRALHRSLVAVMSPRLAWLGGPVDAS